MKVAPRQDMASKLFLTVLTTLGLSVVACSGSSSGDGSLGGDYGARMCALYKPCCEKAGMGSSTQSMCKAMMNSLPPPTSVSAADQCLKDYEELAKSPTFCYFTYQAPASCTEAWPEGKSGGKPPGSSCAHDDDCAGDADCHEDYDTHQKTCVVFVISAQGGACIGEKKGNSKWWSGNPKDNQILLCDYDAGLRCESGICTPRSQVGEPCSYAEDCVAGAYCLNQKCAAQLAPGAACSGTTDHECNAETYCSSANKCEALHADGEACTDDKECYSDTCSANVCKYNPGLGAIALPLMCQ
jgi:hypothetical protein